MRTSRNLDMTEGPIARQIISFAAPMLIGLVFQQLYNTVDTFVVGNFVNHQALAAVGTTGPLINTLLGFFNGFSAGATVVIARAVGAHDNKGVHDAVHTTILMTLIMAVLFTIAGTALVPTLLHLMKAPEDMFDEAVIYLRIYFLGVSGLMLYNMGAGILRAVGDSRRPLYFLIFSALLNTGGDLLFVIKFHMGVAGVAYATILAQGLSALLVILSLLRADGAHRLFLGKLRIRRDVLHRIVSIGLPTALQAAITAFSNVFVQSYINVYGSACAGGWTVYAKLDQFAMLPQQAVSMASATFVGQNLGAVNLKRTKQGIRTALLIGGACTLTLMLPLMLCSRFLLGLFNQDPDVLYYGQMFMLWITPFYLVTCVNDIIGSALRGAGESLAVMTCMLSSFVVIRQIYLYTVSRLTQSALFIGLGYPLGWVVCAVSLLLCYRYIPWEKKQLSMAKAAKGV